MTEVKGNGDADPQAGKPPRKWWQKKRVYLIGVLATPLLYPLFILVSIILAVLNPITRSFFDANSVERLSCADLSSGTENKNKIINNYILKVNGDIKKVHYFLMSSGYIVSEFGFNMEKKQLSIMRQTPFKIAYYVNSLFYLIQQGEMLY